MKNRISYPVIFIKKDLENYLVIYKDYKTIHSGYNLQNSKIIAREFLKKIKILAPFEINSIEEIIKIINKRLGKDYIFNINDLHVEYIEI
jgi:hypothetical protein